MKSFLALLSLLLVTLASAEERILSFHSRIEIMRSGEMEVTETIKVASEENNIRHGIYRDFPQLYKSKWGLREDRPFTVISVTRNGIPELYNNELHEAGVRVRIGNKQVFLPADTYTYVLRYRTAQQLLFFDSHDELYWNVTGNEWAFPILEASAEVILPDGISIKSIEGYLGPKGSKETTAPTNPELGGNTTTLATGRRLTPGEGFTLVATWPAKSLDPAAYEAAKSRIFRDNPFVIVSACLLLAMLIWHIFAWISVGRDPDPGLIIPQFGPPDGWSPAAVRMLDRMGFDNICFSAAVMGLAVKNRLTISGSEKKPTLKRTSTPPTEPLAKEETALYNALLGQHDQVELVQANHKTVAAARSALMKSLQLSMEKTHFKSNLRHWLPGFFITLIAVALLLISGPEPAQAAFMTFWLSIWSLGTGALVSAVFSHARSGKWLAALPMALFSLPFLGGWFTGVFFLIQLAGIPASAAFVIGIVINMLFYHWIKAPTHLGRKILDHIEGFRLYLGVAEADRLGGFAGPDQTPELFEKFLPYAHALGVEQKWSEKFAEILKAAAISNGETNYRPRFYTGSHTGFDGAMAAAALGGALTSALTTASTSPRSSGSGGGGSSGGGGGGGGGGGW
jgi:uncharacterized membrane protein YgcG